MKDWILELIEELNHLGLGDAEEKVFSESLNVVVFNESESKVRF
jgi:hypothetical protein